MARATDDDILEPILPKHPPVAVDPALPSDGATAWDGPAEGGGPGAGRTLPSWDRLVLVGCAVVATLALVVCALRLSSIADDQRLQACQVRVYAEEQIDAGAGRGSSERTLRERFADCLGVGVEDDGAGDEGADED